MNEFDTGAPKLTLDFSTPESVSDAAKAVSGTAKAVSAEAAISTSVDTAEMQLTAEERKMVTDFAKQIDVRNSAQIMNYGAGTQQKMASFSDKVLDNVRTNDTGEIGDMLTDLVLELKGFDAEETKGIRGWFKKAAVKTETLKIRYDKAESNVNKIVQSLEQNQIQLLKDMSVLDQMYDANLNYYKELTMYIMAGREKLAELEKGELVELKNKAAASGRAEDAQAVNDLQTQMERFDKKLSDLDLTRMVSIQTAPQIRLIQNNDAMLSEKIQSTIVNTIPLWKNQMLIALGISHSQQAMQAQRAVNDMTNELLKKNAESLKIAAADTAREAERGIVDIETLKQTNATLIETLDEIQQIQSESGQKRREAEQELRKMEDDIKTKLLEMSR